MKPSREVLPAVAMGVSLFVFTALGAAPPADETGPAGEEARLHAVAGSCCSVEVVEESGSPPDPLLALLIQDAEKPAASKSEGEASPGSIDKGVATRKALLAQLMSLMDDGVADCCNDPGCAMCLIAADRCDCGPSLTKGGPVCPECWGAWQAGQGMIPNVKPEDVKVLPKSALEKLYESKAKKIDEAANAE